MTSFKKEVIEAIMFVTNDNPFPIFKTKDEEKHFEYWLSRKVMSLFGESEDGGHAVFPTGKKEWFEYEIEDFYRREKHKFPRRKPWKGFIDEDEGEDGEGTVYYELDGLFLEGHPLYEAAKNTGDDNE